MIIHIFLNMHLSLIFEQTCEPLLGSDPSVEIHSHAIQIENDYDNMCRNMIISNDQSKMFTWHEKTFWPSFTWLWVVLTQRLGYFNPTNGITQWME